MFDFVLLSVGSLSASVEVNNFLQVYLLFYVLGRFLLGVPRVLATWAGDGEQWTVRNKAECAVLKEMQQNSCSS